MRVMVLSLPAFRLERCGYEADAVAGLIAEEKSAMRLQAVTPAAQALGLRPFQTATAARALVPEVELVPWEEAEEARDRQALVRACAELSDRVRAPWPDGLVMDVTSTARHFGGEAGVLGRALELMASLGHQARGVVADDATAARALSVWSAGGVVPPGEGAQALATLPLHALEPSDGVREALRAVGVVTVGALAALTASSVATRFGEEGALLHAVARGGCAPGLVDWAEPESAERRVRVAMGGATSTLQLHFVLPGLLSQLSQRLGRRGEAVVRLRVAMHLEPTKGVPPVVAVSVRVGRPTRSPRALEPLVRMRLEGVQLQAPVDELVLEAVEVAAEQGWQPGLTDRTEATEPLPDLLARLADHLGDDALFGASLADAWRPETSWRPVPWPPTRLVARATRKRLPDDPVELQQHHERIDELPRPSLLLAKPTPLEVRVHDEAPCSVRTERGWQQVQRRVGPERLRSEWWSDDYWSRDYWVVCVDGIAQWLFVTPEGHWFLHGLFD